jgi:stage V sporulation protein B
MARFAADVSGLAFGIVAGIITARWLGPAGKGLLSAVTLLCGFCIQVAIIGLGETAMVAIGQKRNTRQEVLETSIAILIPATLVGIAALLGASRFEFHRDWTVARIPVLVACLAIPVNLLNQLVACIINAEERVVFTSVLLTASSAIILAATWVFVVVARWAVTGAVLASILGVGVTGLVAAGWLGARGMSFVPKIHRSYLKFAFSFGPKVQLSNMLIGAAARLDVLVVYLLAGQSSAGIYSVALTVGMLSSLLPSALMMASFPRIASLGSGEAAQLILRLNRLTLAASAAAAVVIGALSPFLIPIAFSKAYSASVIPAVILLAGGVAASSQYMLARARAARGEPSLLLRSYALNTVIMLLLDFLLIPKFGVTGAAIASALGSFAGLTISVVATVRVAGRRVAISELLPGMAELRDLALAPTRIFSRPAASETTGA